MVTERERERERERRERRIVGLAWKIQKTSSIQEALCGNGIRREREHNKNFLIDNNSWES